MKILQWMLIMSIVCMPASYADSIIAGHLSHPFYDVYRPKTREEIYSSYRALVEKRDGISKLEARLIAQYEAVLRDLDHGYELGKPKVIKETGQEWTVRFPSKFSINDRRRPPDMLAVVDKKKGNCQFAESDRSDHEDRDGQADIK